MIYYFGKVERQFEIPIMASIASSPSFCFVPLNYRPRSPKAGGVMISAIMENLETCRTKDLNITSLSYQEKFELSK